MNTRVSYLPFNAKVKKYGQLLKGVSIVRKLVGFACLTIALLGGLSQKAQASHVAGGDIEYTCVGQDSFLITARFYRDCFGISAPTSISLNATSSCGQSVITNVYPSSSSPTQISQLCDAEIGNSVCSGGSEPGMEEYIFETIMVLSPSCNTWTISYAVNSRNPSVNVPSSGTFDFYVETTLNSATAPCNNSPTFTAQPSPYVCAGQQVDYSYGVTELDGDSLHFYIDAGSSAQNTPLSYGSGFSATAPIPGITIDSKTGHLSFLAPVTIGNYIVVVCVEEYDSATGQLKGSVCRDMQFIVQTCTNVQPELVGGGIQNFSGTGIQIDSNSVEVCLGNTISFDIQFDDLDVNDTVELIHNIHQVLPGATVTVSPGNPATLSVDWLAVALPNNFNVFSVWASDNACEVRGISAATIDITTVSATYAGSDQTICMGSQSAQLSAVGGSMFTWSVISGDPITSSNFSCTSCANPVASPSVTTTYQVVSNLTAACVNVDTVTVFVAPDYDITLPQNIAICSIQDIQLYANPDQSGQYTWQWSQGSSLNFDTVQAPIANPLENTTYAVTVTSSLGCIKSDSVTVSLSPSFPPNITMGPVDPNDTIVCIGDQVPLATNLGDLTPTSCGLAASSCMGVTQQATIGTGTATNTGTSFPAPYGNYYWGARHQMLFTAAELNAAGITGGKISSLAFDVAAVGATQNFQQFEIKMGCTNISQLTSWQTGLSTVLPGATHTVTTGWNNHQFATPYGWDGVSNIIVEVCFNNSSYVSNGNSLTRYTTTTFQSVIYDRADNANVCFNSPFTNQSSNRPNVRFDYCTGADPLAFNYAWDVGNGLDGDTTVTPGGSGAGFYDYTVYVSDTFGGCIDTITTQIEAVTQFDASFELDDPLCLNGGLDTASVIIAGGVFSGTGIIDTALGIFDPTVSGVGTHPISYTLSGNCGNSSTIGVEVIPLPDATITSSDEYCIVGGPFQLTSATPGGVWSGPGVNSAGSYNPTNIGLGTYMITYTLNQSCFNQDSILIKNILPYDPEIDEVNYFICASDTADTLTFTVPTGGSYGTGPFDVTWSGPGIVDPVNGVFNASLAGAGIHTITVTVAEPNGSCGEEDTYDIIVYELPDASFTAGGFCVNDNSTYAIVPVTPGIGTWSETPIPPTTGTLYPNSFVPSSLGLGSWILEYEVVDNSGCSSVFTDTLSVLEVPDPTIIVAGNILTCDLAEMQYQWFYNGSPISGATDKVYIAPQDGLYTVQVSNDGCVGMSDVVNADNTGIESVEELSSMRIYPNPANENAIVKLETTISEETTLRLFNALGQVVYSRKWALLPGDNQLKLELAALPSGLYKLVVDSKNDVKVKSLVIN